MARARTGLLLLIVAAGALAYNLSSEQDLDTTFLTGDGDSLQLEPALAAHDGGFLAVWSDLRTSSSFGDIRGAWLDPGGQKLNELIISAGPLAEFHPAVWCGPSMCLVVWQAETNTGAQLRGARYPFRGATLDPLPIALTAVPSGRFDAVVSVGNGRALVVWSEDGTITAQQLELGNAQLLGAPIVVSARPEWEHSPRVAWDGTAWHVVWEADPASGDEVRHTTVATNGAVATDVRIAAGSRPALGWGPDAGLVTWLRTDGGSIDVLASRLGSIGLMPFDTPPLALDNIGPYAEFYRGIAPVTDGFIAMWSTDNQAVRTRLVRTDAVVGPLNVLTGLPSAANTDIVCGTATCPWLAEATAHGLFVSSVPLTGAPAAQPLALSVAPPSQREATAVWVGDGFLAYWVEASNGVTAVRGRRLNPLGLAANGTVHGVGSTSPIQRWPVLAGQGGDVALAWYDENASSRILAAQLSASGDLVGVPVAAPGTPVDRQPALVHVSDGRFLLGLPMASSVRGARLVLDGGARLAPDQAWFTQSTSAFGLRGAFATDAGTALFTWYEGSNGIVHFGAVDALTALPRGPAGTLLSPGNFDVNPAAASDGRDFLVAWSTNGGGDSIYAARVRADGTVLDLPSLLIHASPESRESPGHPAVAFDGQRYLVAYEALGDDAGADVHVREVETDGTLGGTIVLTATAREDELDTLVTATPGRLLAVMRRSADLNAGQRNLVKMITAVPEGEPCFGTEECVIGSCVRQHCARSGGGQGGGSAGGGGTGGGAAGGSGNGGAGGAASARLHHVGCGCASSPSLLALVALLSLRVRRYGARRGCSASPSPRL